MPLKQLVDGVPLIVERGYPCLNSGPTADAIVPSGQSRKLIPGQVSVDSADDRERGDIGDGKAGPAYELVIDQEAFRGGDCGERSLVQRGCRSEPRPRTAVYARCSGHSQTFA